MLYLECDIKQSPGMRESDVIATVSDFRGRKEQLQVEKAFLVQRGGRTFLPVWGLAEDRDRKLAEVELPQESASGTNRIWVELNKMFTSETSNQVPASLTHAGVG
jgi:hypothetical protein